MRELIAGNIARASTKETQVASAATPEPEPTPEAAPEPTPEPVAAREKPELAAVASAPLSPPPAAASYASAAIPHPGSSAPITPVRVKTVSVKLVPPKAAAAAKPEAHPVRTAQAEPTRTVPVAVKPVEAKPVEAKPVERQEAAASVPAPAVKKTVLASAIANARAAIVPSAKADEAPRVSRHGWVIQVGAFEDETEAKQRLHSAQSKGAPILGKAEPYTEKTSKGEKTYFRARFAGFDQAGAEAACRKLKRSDIVCMALKI
jgi:D-alanyl-D-alanine carboxypeptidase